MIFNHLAQVLILSAFKSILDVTMANIIASDPTINIRTQIMELKYILKSNNR